MKAKDQALLEHLKQFLTDERRAMFLRVAANRTRYLTVVLENIFHPYNASAVLRSCESLGLQDVHIITEHYGDYAVNKDVVAGSAKWLHIHQHPTTVGGIESLKAQGYRIVATSPHAHQTIDELDLSRKTAIVFGAEALGVSDYTFGQADETVAIPMYGFTESFNISVSAALCLRSFIEKLHRSDIDWRLSQEEQVNLLLEWIKTSVKSPEIHERYFEQHVWPNISK